MTAADRNIEEHYIAGTAPPTAPDGDAPILVRVHMEGDDGLTDWGRGSQAEADWLFGFLARYGHMPRSHRRTRVLMAVQVDRFGMGEVTATWKASNDDH